MRASALTVLALLWRVSWPQWRQQALQQGLAVLAVVLGVALAFSVHLINESALGEFSAAVRGVQGQADASVKPVAANGEVPLGVLEQLARQVALVAVASPVVEVHAVHARGALKIVGLDPLLAAPLGPQDMPRLAAGTDPQALFAPLSISLNARALQLTGARPGEPLAVTVGGRRVVLTVVGEVGSAGAPLGVMDVAGAQALTGRFHSVSRVDLALAPGVTADDLRQRVKLPAELSVETPEDGQQRVSNVSRAYRVNLTVLALVALFTGSFLVFSVLSLSVAQRQTSLALLGVLGLSARERLALVLAESALTGLLGALLGLGLGTALAQLALSLLGGDLGGGYFTGVAPALRWSTPAALVYGLLGTAAAVLGGWLPARSAQGLVPAQALKGLGGGDAHTASPWWGPGLLLLGAGLCLLPPLGGVPLAAYVGVACLLMGGIASVPSVVGGVLARWPAPGNAPTLLALERARRMRHTVTVAVAGVVASLSLSVALTVMVGSFRASVTQWLDVVLPADLYARVSSPANPPEGSPQASDGASRRGTLDHATLAELARLPGVSRVAGVRTVTLRLNPQLPDVALISRSVADPAQTLPLVGELLPDLPGVVNVYVSEAMVDLHQAHPGSTLALPLQPGRPPVVANVRGVWRDYARQHGAVVMHEADFLRLTGDERLNDVALWLRRPQDADAVKQGVRRIALARGVAERALELSEPGQIRTLTLGIFDRSFAVTYWLQAVAIAIGLFGTAASFSAQVMARRKEFGLLSHLGFTRRQVLGVVAGEGLVLTGLGALVGLLLGLAVSVVLVKVVNPQSFHWTMDLQVPALRLWVLCAGVVVSGTLTAVVAGRQAVSRQAVLAVKEDW